MGFKPMPDARRWETLGENHLTSRTSYSYVFNIEYKLYTCIYVFCKINKSCRAGSALQAEATAQARYNVLGSCKHYVVSETTLAQ
jgi:hypothetical protein